MIKVKQSHDDEATPSSPRACEQFRLGNETLHNILRKKIRQSAKCARLSIQQKQKQKKAAPWLLITK